MRVYRKAGVAISWIVCKSSKMEAEADLGCHDPPSAIHLNLRIVPHASKSRILEGNGSGQAGESGQFECAVLVGHAERLLITAYKG
jgi:hypothetical protein